MRIKRERLSPSFGNSIGMNEINCPECGKVFKIDEAGYANILKHVRDDEFEAELLKRLELAEEDKLKSIEITKKNIKIEMQEFLSIKDSEIQKIQALKY